MKKTSLAIALGILAGQGWAAEEYTSIAVTGQVVNSCTISAPATMDFGAMETDEVKALNDQISVTCNNGAAYTIRPHDAASISVTGQLNGSPMNRSTTMTGGTSSIDVGIGTVALFKNAAATTPWSDAATISGTGNSSAQTHDFALKFTHDGTNYGNFSFTLRPTIAF